MAALLLPASAMATDGTIELRGEIDMAAVNRVVGEARGRGVSTLLVDSPGGDLLAGIALARWVHARGVELQVQGLCASACANYLFPAARRRVVHPGALVVWHGGAFQADFVQWADTYETALLRVEQGLPDAADHERVAHGADRWRMLKLQQALESSLYTSLQVHCGLPTIGQQRGAAPVAWTLTAPTMSALGIGETELPPGYGSSAYVQAWLAARAAADRTRIVVLDPASALRTACQP